MKKRLLQGVLRVFVVSGNKLNSPIEATRVTILEFLERSVRSGSRSRNQFQVSAGCILITVYSTKRSTGAGLHR
jgi:hypothetical protein